MIMFIYLRERAAAPATCHSGRRGPIYKSWYIICIHNMIYIIIICVCVYIYIYMYVCVDIYIYIYIYDWGPTASGDPGLPGASPGPSLLISLLLLLLLLSLLSWLLLLLLLLLVVVVLVVAVVVLGNRFIVLLYLSFFRERRTTTEGQCGARALQCFSWSGSFGPFEACLSWVCRGGCQFRHA